MKTVKLEIKKRTLWQAAAGWTWILTAFLLLTGCSSTKTATGTSAMGETQAVQTPEVTLSDDYALLHIYRVGRMAGAAIGYDVNLDGEKVYRATNKSKITIRVTEAGLHTLSAKTESSAELPLDIQLGREYYVRCGMKMGVMVGRPELEIVDASTGKTEFNNIPSK
jgi:Protein of unknown function (DUF2846).